MAYRYRDDSYDDGWVRPYQPYRDVGEWDLRPHAQRGRQNYGLERDPDPTYDPYYNRPYYISRNDIDRRSRSSGYLSDPRQVPISKSRQQRCICFALAIFCILAILLLTALVIFLVLYSLGQGTQAGTPEAVTVTPTDQPVITTQSPFTGYAEVNGSMTMMQTFLPQYNDKQSDEYKALENSFIAAMDSIFLSSSLRNGYEGTVVNGFSPGSIRVLFIIFFAENVVDLVPNPGLGQTINFVIQEEVNNIVVPAVSNGACCQGLAIDSNTVEIINVIVSRTTASPQSTAAPDVVTTAAPDVVTTAAPDVVTTAAPDTVTTAAPDVVTTAAPDAVTTAAPDAVTTAAPDVVTTAAPDAVTTAAPDVVTTAAPDVVTTAAPNVVTTAAPDVVTTAAPNVVTTAAPDVVTTAAPDVVTTAVPDVVTTADPDVGTTAAPTVSTTTPAVSTIASTTVPFTTTPEIPCEINRNISNTSVCGVSNAGNISLDPQPADHGSWPWVGSLQLTTGLGCGVTLIGDQWAVTSASCVSDVASLVSVLFGTVKNTYVPSDRGVQVAIERVHIHPGYNPTTFVSNIAFLKLAEPIPPNENVKPICIDEDGYQEGDTCVTAGWGTLNGELGDILMNSAVLSLSSGSCSVTVEYDSPEKYLCAEFSEEDSSRIGDSASGLMCNRAGKWILVGIADLLQGRHVLATNLLFYMDEITSLISCGGFEIPCQAIEVPLCQAALPYVTTFPQNQSALGDFIAEVQARPVLDCHDKSAAVLCAALLPDCNATSSRQTICQETCEDVLETCQDLFSRILGLDVDCRQYPGGSPNAGGLCNADDFSCGNDSLNLNGLFDKVSLSSPNYPQPYSGYDDCLWIVNAPPDSHIILKITELDTESCCDILTIGEGSDFEDGTSISQRVSGTSPPPPIVLPFSVAWIRFQSDGATMLGGFQMDVIAVGNSSLGSFCSEANTYMCSDGVSCIPFEWRCDGVYDCLLRDDELCQDIYQEFTLGIDGSQHLISPGYYTTGYQSYTIHTYIITTVPGNKLIVNFDGFSSEQDFDFLYVGDGSDPQNETSLFFRWSGQSLPPTLLSEMNQMWIRFRSDFSINNKGYNLHVFDVPGSVTFDCEASQYDCGHRVCIPQAFVCNDRQECVDGSDENGCVQITALGGITLMFDPSPLLNDSLEYENFTRSFVGIMNSVINSSLSSGYIYRGTYVQSIGPFEVTSGTVYTTLNYTIHLTDVHPTSPTNETIQMLLGILLSEVSDDTLGDFPVLTGSLQLYTAPPPLCEAGQFECSSQTCIDLDSVCDLTLDCPDGSDEAVGPHCPFACGATNITLTAESSASILNTPSFLPDEYYGFRDCRYVVTGPPGSHIYVTAQFHNLMYTFSHALLLDFGQDVVVSLTSSLEQPLAFLSLTNTIEISLLGYYWEAGIGATITLEVGNRTDAGTCDNQVQLLGENQTCNGVYDCLDMSDEANCNAQCGQSNYSLDYNQIVNLSLTNYPEPYNNNTLCVWFLTGPPGAVLVFRVEDLDLPEGDVLLFGQGHNPGQSSLVTTVPGILSDKVIFVGQNQGYIAFQSDAQDTGRGFVVKITAVEEQDADYIRCANGIQLVPVIQQCDGVAHCEGNPTDEVDCDQCTNIPVSQCASDLPYSVTFFPNAFAGNAADAMAQYQRAEETFCTSNSSLVMCLLLFPPCPSPGSPTEAACRDDCKSAIEGCGFRQGVCDALPQAEGATPLCPYVGDFLETGICGTVPLASNVDPRIVNGDDADEGEWPWTVVVLDSEYRHRCGGSLINSQWAVTAAHCADVIDSILAGVRNLANIGTNYELVAVSEVIVHELYGVFDGNSYDIALMKLERPVEFSDYIRPVCLNAEQNETEIYTKCYATGWGALEEDGPTADILQEVRLPLIDLEDCQRMYSGEFVINEQMICAGFEEGGKDSCQGDSGGPFVCETSDGRWTLVGATSFGTGCARPGKPGVYARISQYIDFIEHHVNKDPPPPQPII